MRGLGITARLEAGAARDLAARSEQLSHQAALDLPIVRVLAHTDATSLNAVADAAAP